MQTINRSRWQPMNINQKYKDPFIGITCVWYVSVCGRFQKCPAVPSPPSPQVRGVRLSHELMLRQRRNMTLELKFYACSVLATTLSKIERQKV